MFINVGNRPVIFLAEGLFMYFEESLVQNFVKDLAVAFPKGRLLFEALAPVMVGKSKRHETLNIEKNGFQCRIQMGLKRSLGT